MKNQNHNPYFNRWFSAIQFEDKEEVVFNNHNPYFNRWFSAIIDENFNCPLSSITILILIDGFLQYEPNNYSDYWNNNHNPYFNRWFSAM